MAEGHAGFAVLNRVGNPVVKAILRSPVRGPLGRRLAVITVTGRRSGRSFSIPVGYARDGDTVRIEVGRPERKRWWRNLRDGGRVGVVLDGERFTGTARARGDEAAGVMVEVLLDT